MSRSNAWISTAKNGEERTEFEGMKGLSKDIDEKEIAQKVIIVGINHQNQARVHHETRIKILQTEQIMTDKIILTVWRDRMMKGKNA